MIKTSLILATCFVTVLPLAAQAACQQAQAELAEQYLLNNPVLQDGGTRPDTSPLHSQPDALVLNGYGTRTKLLWDVYLTALYLPYKSNDAAEILTMSGPQRISLYFLREVPKDKLIEGWLDGFNLNQTEAQMATFESRLETASEHFRTMQEGEIIHFAYQPSSAADAAGVTALYINTQPGQSEPQVRIRGRDFFQAILQIWIGEHPAQQPLKRCLLGQTPSR